MYAVFERWLSCVGKAPHSYGYQTDGKWMMDDGTDAMHGTDGTDETDADGCGRMGWTWIDGTLWSQLCLNAADPHFVL